MTSAPSWTVALLCGITAVVLADDRGDWGTTTAWPAAATVRFAPAPAPPAQWPRRDGDGVPLVDTNTDADPAWEQGLPGTERPVASRPPPAAVNIQGYRFRGADRSERDRAPETANWTGADGTAYRFRHDPRLEQHTAPAAPGYRFRPH